MRKNDLSFALAIIITFAIVGAGISIVFSSFITTGKAQDIHTKSPDRSLYVAKNTAKPSSGSECAVTYNPPSPEDAPLAIRDAVMLGYNIITQTQKYAAEFIGNKLSCDNCHFKGGITEGGKGGGLSLVGISATYPKYRKRQNYSVDLVTRTNDCFKRSMNGRPLPPSSKEMTAILTYYQWISKGLPIYADITWLGLKHIKSTHNLDKTQGKQIFMQKCSMCHGSDEQGTQAAPPLWGSHSFNDGAGMTKPENFSAFAYLNMPLGNPDLTEEQALDVGSYVTSQPRPHFIPQ
jgi:thiosulfate dehydrogenase